MYNSVENQGHMQEPESTDPLDIDRPGYYTPLQEEFFHGMSYEFQGQNGEWLTGIFRMNEGIPEEVSLKLRMKWLQAKDITALGFTKIMQSLPMYQRGSYTIHTYRLLDPTYSRIKITQNGVTVYEGQVKNQSELKRVLKLNQIDFVGYYE